MSSDAENNYQQAYALSLSDPEAFWGLAAEDLHWVKRWEKVLDTSQTPHGQWFVGGELNTCYNALDRHVENGRGDYLALIYDSPVAGNKVARFTYSELKDLTARFAGRPGNHLHADDSRNSYCHVGLCAYWSHSLSGVRGICLQRTCRAYR